MNNMPVSFERHSNNLLYTTTVAYSIPLYYSLVCHRILGYGFKSHPKLKSLSNLTTPRSHQRSLGLFSTKVATKQIMYHFVQL